MGINIQNKSITGNYTDMPVHKSIILCIIAESNFIKHYDISKACWKMLLNCQFLL